MKSEVVQPSHDIDLNIYIVMEQDDRSVILPEMDMVGAGIGDRLLSQDSNLFNLLPIIEAVTRGGAKKSREEDDQNVEIVDEGLYHVKKNPKTRMD